MTKREMLNEQLKAQAEGAKCGRRMSEIPFTLLL